MEETRYSIVYRQYYANDRITVWFYFESYMYTNLKFNQPLNQRKMNLLFYQLNLLVIHFI